MGFVKILVVTSPVSLLLRLLTNQQNPQRNSSKETNSRKKKKTTDQHLQQPEKDAGEKWHKFIFMKKKEKKRKGKLKIEFEGCMYISTNKRWWWCFRRRWRCAGGFWLRPKHRTFICIQCKDETVLVSFYNFMTGIVMLTESHIDSKLRVSTTMSLAASLHHCI
ncbi:hypothetical protein P8452_57591 [Trifolium repens]|nr:hypothetical protein P8452_57591 [Trifolium repens]